MHSKNNNIMHSNYKEYFDSPVDYDVKAHNL